MPAWRMYRNGVQTLCLVPCSLMTFIHISDSCTRSLCYYTEFQQRRSWCCLNTCVALVSAQSSACNISLTHVREALIWVPTAQPFILVIMLHSDCCCHVPDCSDVHFQSLWHKYCFHGSVLQLCPPHPTLCRLPFRCIFIVQF